MPSLAVVSTIGQKGNNQGVETQITQQISSRMRERLSEPAMLDLTKRLIAIPSENPPGNHYEECTSTLQPEMIWDARQVMMEPCDEGAISEQNYAPRRRKLAFQ